MRSVKEINELLVKKILILDGATGTQLQMRGMPAGVCPELWTLEHPDVQEAIHNAYISSGSDVIYTPTFGGNYYKLSEYGCDEVEEVNRKLASVSRKCADNAGKKVLVAGNIGPCGKFIKPFGELDFDEAVEMFKRQIRGLLDGGVDMFAVETQIDIQETRAWVIAIKELCPNFILTTMTFEPTVRTLNGTTPEAALITLQSLGVHAFGCNCSSGPAEMLPIIQGLKPIAHIPLVAKPNAGLPYIKDGKTKFPMGSTEFGTYAAKFAEAGVNFMGGCCGTSPDHIKELATSMAGCSPRPVSAPDYAALSSAREAVITKAGSPVRIIGERINPTGKKKLQAELKEGIFTTVQTFTREQKSTGATILDVNAGMPGINEEETLLKIISLLTPQTSLPLSIDTTNPDAAEKAMRLYPGRPLLNSISGESPRLEKLLPAAAKYGAMFILLPIQGNQIPATAQERITIINNIYAKAKKYGFKKCDILIDGLAMTVSANQKAPAETLKTIKWATQEGFGSVIGLSNISFGLPERKWANAAFLAMATQAGLTHVIANPMEEVLTNIKLASDLLSGTDPDGTNYITSFANKTAAPAAPTKKAESPDEAVKNGIINGIRADIKLTVKTALDSGFKPADILENMMIPAIVHVGDLYEKKEYFLPQLIASAETMKMGFTVLEPLLNSSSREKKGKILFATVEGDIHDIGKNIVILMLRNYGFEVIDLGKDVKASKIVEAAEREKPDIIALSALMTTTMIRMPEVIEQAKLSAIKAAFMVGGAVVTEDWAQSIGAHYSANGVEAVKKAQELIK